MSRRESLPMVLRHFTYIGATAYGLGKALYMQEMFVRRLKWMDNAEFVDGLALSSILPGPNITNLAAYTGFSVGGWPGALLGWLGMLLPGFVVTLGVSVIARSVVLPPVVTGAISGVAAASICLLVANVVRTAPTACGRVHAGWVILVCTFIAVGPLRISVMPVMVIFGVLSIVLNRPRTS